MTYQNIIERDFSLLFWQNKDAKSQFISVLKFYGRRKVLELDGEEKNRKENGTVESLER